MPVEAAIDTDEGTWMSLDVSPDGKEIAFDLLGDIYAVPMRRRRGAGADLGSRVGHAAALLARRPKRIAFTTDRSGGDNVWVMDRDGSHPARR